VTASRYPFRTAVNKFLDVYKDMYSKSTFEERARRLRRIGKEIEYLKSEGKISTADPSHLSAEDVRAFYSLLKGRNLSAKGISHEMNALNVLCTFLGNNSVETAKSKYPMLSSKYVRGRLDCFTRHEFQQITDRVASLDVNDYSRCRAYAVVLLSIGAGLRTKETQYARIENLDLDNGTLFVNRVKGEDTYGEPRLIFIIPDCIPALRRYVESLTIMMGGILQCGYLFPSPKGTALCTNSLRRYKDEIVSQETGLSFPIQKCRRTYGQFALDDGISVESVSVLMGHKTTKTTESYYARRRGSIAVDEAREKWRSN